MQEEMRRRTREAPSCSWLLVFTSQVGRRKATISRWGVLSGIVLRGRESLLQGEGPDGSAQSAKETHTGHSRAGEM